MMRRPENKHAPATSSPGNGAYRLVSLFSFFADWTRMLRTQLKSFFSVLTLLTNFDGRGVSVVPILHCSEITQDRYRLSGVGVIELLI